MKITKLMLTAMFVWCLALLPASMLAQTSTTGTIEGTVIDATGGVLPGVTVTVASPNLILAKSAITTSDGRYRILNLPPGRYTVTAEALPGFNKSDRTDIEVNLSKASIVELRMQPQGTTTTVEVTSSSAILDTTSATTQTSVSTEQFSNFPTQRTVQSLFSIAPTAARSGLRDEAGRDIDPSVGGASGPENNYILDGVTTTDPAFGGSGANIPFEFVQEVQIKTSAFGAEYGNTTGGIFNVLTKSGGNNFHGDVFTFFSTKGMVRKTESFPRTGLAPNGFSEVDAGVDVGGPILRDKLWFYGALNPHRRRNFFLTQTFKDSTNNKVTTPFYAGKLTYGINQRNTLTFSTFGDYRKEEGFLFPNSGFGASPDSFAGKTERGGGNYTVRLNSAITPTFIGEFAVGIHRQRFNTIPAASVARIPVVTDNFAILTGGRNIAPVTTSSTEFTQVIGGTTYNLGPISYVNAPGGGSLERGFVRQGFGLFRTEDRNRWETQARLQNIWGPHSFKYGFEYSRNNYKANATSTGIPQTFGNPEGLTFATPDNNQTLNTRITNNFSACTTRVIAGLNTIVCPAAAATARAALIAVAAGFPGGAITDRISAAEASANPFLVRLSTRVRDFQLRADTHTNVESFYMQDEFKLTRDIQLLGGLRWDFQQSYGNKGKTYLKLDKFWYNMQPRVGAIWDFTGRGRGKLFANYALFVETPIPLDVNVRAGSDNSQTDKNFNVNLVNAPPGSTIVTGIRGNPRTGAVNLGAEVTPIDPDLRPQTVHEVSAGVEYEIARNLAVGLRGIYRAQGSVIEDGSFDDGDTYFLFNPGQSLTDRIAGTREETGFQRFGRARRYYRAVEFTATKRFSQNYHFLASYVYSSLTGNYEGLFRNDNGQRDPNITSLFDLVSLLKNTYGRLPNDRPHQFKLNGGYTLPFNLTLNSSISAQSGIPINELIPHPVYGNNEGFGKPRGTVGRTNSTMTWDFGAYYPIKFGDNYQLRFQLDWFNVLNHQHAVRVDETFTLNSGVTGVPPISNPFYRNGTIFQFPSNVRLGVKLQF